LAVMISHEKPIVSVVISTFNWSSVLRYAVTSVLRQSFEHFELIVVGDCCTDDSENVVKSFDDPRIRWHNLVKHSGGQFGPNNQGAALARGRYIAYLGHDDLWHRDHLAVLVAAIETNKADLVFSITEDIGPPSMPTRGVLGLAPKGIYEWSLWAPPSSWLHRRDLLERVGHWRDSRTIVMTTDADFLNRVYDLGCRIVPVEELTVFKFPSAARTGAYVQRRCDEQAEWWERLCNEPELRYRELVEVLKNWGKLNPELVARFTLPSRAIPGSQSEALRLRRGLPLVEGPAPAVDMPPIFADRTILRHLNAEKDIGPADNSAALHHSNELPLDGLFLGFNWHSLELDAAGARWRWIDTDAQIILTRPSATRRRLAIDMVPGPGVGGTPCRLQLRDAAGAVVAEAAVDSGGEVVFALPVHKLVGLEGAIFSLGTEDGGRTIRGDPRVLNFRIFSFGWANDPTTPAH
jgi:glycosyltransferase involved in cell wall biosynthesis